MPNLVKEYNVFEHEQYRHLMPKLKDSGLRPLNTADLMREKLEALNSKDLQLIAFWLDRYFYTSDGVAYDGDKRKIAYNANQLINIKPDSNLINGALPIEPDEYKNLEAEEFSSRQLERAGFDRRLSGDEVINHPFWIALARGDKHLLREYRDAIFAVIKRRYYGDSQGMGVYLDSEQKQPSMRALAVDYPILSRSNANGRSNLDDWARLVGAPEDIERAAEALKIIKGIAKPEIIEPLEALVRKSQSLQ